MKLNLSLLLTILFLLTLFVLWLLPINLYSDFLFTRPFLANGFVYYFKYFPLVIICISIYELINRKKPMLAITSILVCVGIFTIVYWITQPMYHYNKNSDSEEVGQITFDTEGRNSKYKFSCKFDFTLKVEIEKKSEELVNEIRTNRDYILTLVKEIAQDNCAEDDFEKLVNDKCLDAINNKLKTGKIKGLYFGNSSTFISKYGGAE